MEGEPRFVGIDVSKAQVDVAVRPTGQRWVVSYDETGIKELVSQMVDLGPAMVLLEATGGLELPLVAALAAARPDGLMLNIKREPFTDHRVRQAINLAVDRQKHNERALHGAGRGHCPLVGLANTLDECATWPGASQGYPGRPGRYCKSQGTDG